MTARVIVSLLGGCLLLLGGPSVQAGEWQTFSGCTLVSGQNGDGDSFLVQAGDQQIHVRLYFVDAPETVVASDADAKRVREQARHFGLVDPARVVHYGKQARDLTERVLARPFIVQTTFATALGRSSTKRVYALVTTAEGDDLGRLLVQRGLARAYGVTRSLPNGEAAELMAERLADLELQAMLLRQGAWAETDAATFFQLREEQRREELELKGLRDRIRDQETRELLVDLNRGSRRELQDLPGIGPVLAARIIESRPFASVDDLRRVTGINDRLLDSLRPYIIVSD